MAPFPALRSPAGLSARSVTGRGVGALLLGVVVLLPALLLGVIGFLPALPTGGVGFLLTLLAGHFPFLPALSLCLVVHPAALGLGFASLALALLVGLGRGVARRGAPGGLRFTHNGQGTPLRPAGGEGG
jgi:hypothetical protein